MCAVVLTYWGRDLFLIKLVCRGLPGDD